MASENWSKQVKFAKWEKLPQKGRTSALPNNPISRLQLRELGGIHRHHRQSVATQVFQKLPGRLGFSLRVLVPESVLCEGHVFLGFSKSGQFILSYTLNVEADEHTAYPVYVYRLQWWHFVPYKRLRKVSEVRLFGEEDIQQDLFLSICEWPNNDTRIVVHGYCAPSRDEEKRQCYVTITAVPPVDACEDCRLIQAQNGFNGGLYETFSKCLTHSLTVHTKYELAPPYPVFTPKIFLKLDGIVLVNTGDSLVALSVQIENNNGRCGFALYSPRVARSDSNISSASSTTSSDGDSQDRVFDDETLMTDLLIPPVQSPSHGVCPSILPNSPASNVCQRNQTVPKDATNTTYCHLPESRSRDRHCLSGKENHLSKNESKSDLCGSSSESFAHHEASSVNRFFKSSIDVYNFDSGTPNKDDDSIDYLEVPLSINEGSGPGPLSRPACSTLSFTHLHQGANVQSSSEDVQDIPVSTETDDKQTIFEKPNTILRLQIRDGVSASHSPRTFAGLSIVSPDIISLGRGLALSPGYSKFDRGGSSTCSSCISSPIILQNESQCFTYSVRRYMEAVSSTQRPDSPVDLEDDLNLAYHSLLPLEVRGANYCSMRLLTKQYYVTNMPCVAVKQLTLDVEHYIAEAVKLYAEWGHRYLAFRDYDIQIVDVCSETAQVIAVVHVLIRARPPKDKQKQHTPGSRSIPRLYQTGFKLTWNLQTGSYKTLDVEDLVEISQTELFRTKQWHPGNKICDTLYRRFAVPHAHHQLVHVLTNEAVFRGQSLKMLLDREHYIAIFL